MRSQISMSTRTTPAPHFLQKAITKVKDILHDTKHPILAADCHHKYDDKYLLAEYLVNTALVSMFDSTLSTLNLSSEVLAKLKEWCNTQTVYLSCEIQQGSSYLYQ